MPNNLFDSYEIVTGLFYNQRTSSYFKFLQTNDSVKMVPVKEVKFKEIIKQIRFPMWLLQQVLELKWRRGKIPLR